MVTGHISLAYAAGARWPRAQLAMLLVATMLPDLADFVMPQGGSCRTPCGLYTHAFPAVLVLAGAMAGLSWGIWHRRIAALLSGGLVLMHVAFDFVTGNKPFWFGGPTTGLYLFRYPAADFALESVLMVAGWALLRRTPHAPRWAVHPATLAALIAFQAAFDVLQSRALRG